MVNLIVYFTFGNDQLTVFSFDLLIHLWGYLKAYIYRDKQGSFDALEVNIEAFIREIPVDMLERVFRNEKQ